MRLPFLVIHLTHTRFFPGGMSLGVKRASVLSAASRSCFLYRIRLRERCLMVGFG